MARTIRIYLQNIEKQQTMIHSLTALKTENSRLKEMITSKTGQIEEMTLQLQTVSDARKSLHDLLTSLFNRITMIKKSKEAMEHILSTHDSKVNELRNQKEQLLDEFHSAIHARTLRNRSYSQKISL